MEIRNFTRKSGRNVLKLDNYKLHDGTEIPMLRFPKIAETGIAEHCFSTRMGGVSEQEFASLDFSFGRGDDPAKVAENFSRIAEALHTDPGRMIVSHQTHTTNVIRVTSDDCGYGVTRPRPYEDVDGLVTDEPEVVLVTLFADCVPLYFVDPVHRAIGLSHSGWKGTVNRMGMHTLEKMKKEFGTDPADVIAAVGPSICQDCYEVSADVAERFMTAFPGHGSELLIAKPDGKYQLDLWMSNYIVLTEAGIRPEHLAVTDICTCCNPKLLFSHRATKGKRGNLAAFLYLKKPY